MTDAQAYKHVFRLWLLSMILLACLLSGCTLVRYTSPDRSLTVIDIHPTQNAISLEGVINDTASLSVNREQGGTEGLVKEVGDAVNPIGVPGL